ncbi:hypothetical protein CLV46_0571 [Diaminobutyricimonas aerilata]|uniref:Uncharacterized protein n=2 Tax=Diaminobutyricimonas aerilata TaxID=1162967 RepID=A0A2M9CGI3_9MICO|nr:hypothetical protein CLV46_0571 [Diaminobutyricimonas aerilata]
MSMSDEHEPRSDESDHDGLVSRLRVIEDQPLETRAEAFGQLYAELRAELDGPDQPAR